ncbi:tyrosine-protein phosphatase [Halioxenophilus aromaticivorans]|uniref:Tyrosine specific protein phosphatases domain-containing protein n=1 Tax=Halioxenophilus aromaticivorans TaxID=1306992 RepID=A0AAV3TX77_9ALTE
MTGLSNLQIQKCGADGYQLRWQCEPGTEVTVYKSHSPHGGFKRYTVTQDNSAVIDGMGPRGYYLLKSPAGYRALFERRIDLKGTPNLRDFGGYTNEDGDMVKLGLLYRSGRLSALTQADASLFHGLGIANVYDFRRPEEAALHPTVASVMAKVKAQALPIGEGSMRSFEALLYDANLTESDLATGMRGIYKDLATFHATTYQVLLRQLMEIEKPILIHCTAGKDRTGMGAALILMALGVDRETIKHDYLATRAYYPTAEERRAMQEQYLAKGGVLSTLDYLLSVQPEFIDVLFELIDAEYDSNEEYLRHRLELSDADLNTLRSALLTQPHQLLES